MSRVFTVYKVGGIGLHGEVKAVMLAGLDSDVRGSFIEIASWLKCGILVNRNADGVIVGSIDWRGENKWRGN